MANIRVFRAEQTPTRIQIWATYDGAYHDVSVDKAQFDALDMAGKKALVGLTLYEAEQKRLNATYGFMVNSFTYTPPGGIPK
jgi:hypothetical protein